jgi:hypothetical protein
MLVAGKSPVVRSKIAGALGGIPPLPSREDLAFVAKAVAAGYRLRHALDITVGVSVGLDGLPRKAPLKFAL